jgi:predicted transcriptional regulator
MVLGDFGIEFPSLGRYNISDLYYAGLGRRRSRLEVKIEILKAISLGAIRQTQIMHDCNLSWSFAQTFIRILEKQGLISVELLRGRKTFTLSERGRRALAAYTTVNTALEGATIRKSEAPLEEET